MQHRDVDAEAIAKSADRLRRQGDLGHQHEGLLTAFERGACECEINLGLAAAGDAVEQEGCKATAAAHGIDRSLLFAVEGAQVCRIRYGLGIDRFDPASGTRAAQGSRTGKLARCRQ